MASRQLNPDRIRRHMARSTPDEIQALFDIIADDYEEKTHEWLSNFSDKMMYKYGERPRIDVMVDQDYGRFSHKVLVIARAVKISTPEFTIQGVGRMRFRMFGPTSKEWRSND